MRVLNWKSMREFSTFCVFLTLLRLLILAIGHTLAELCNCCG